MKWLVGLACFAVSATVTLAEGPLTLDDCLSEAAENNPDLAAAVAAVQKATYDYRASYGPLLPQVSANAQSSKNRSPAGSSGGGVTSDNASYGVSASQSLFTGGKNRAAVDLASANLESVTADLDGARATLSFDVWKAFADLLFAQEQIELSQQILKRRQENLALLQLRYEGGMENKGALLLMQASEREAEFGVAQAKRNLRVAQRELARALGRRETDQIRVTGKLEAELPETSVDLEALAAQTPTHRKTVAQLRFARAGLASAKSQYYPDVSANASASKTGDNWMPDQDEWFLGVTLNFPFFTGGQNVMNVRGARAQIVQAEETLKLTDAQLVFNLEQTLAGYGDAVEQTVVRSGFLHAEEVRAEIARSQYSSGMLSFEDWDRIENGLISSQKDDLSGRLNAVLAEASWERVQGKSRLPEM
jgi:outer membrane protein TolC